MIRLSSLVVVGIGMVLLLLAGCGGAECNKGVSSERIEAVDQAQLKTDLAAIDDYLATNNVANVQTHSSGIRYVITKAASGGTPCLENQVSVIYDVKFFPTLKLIESSRGSLSTFVLGTSNLTIQIPLLATQIMLPTFPKGTKATLYIPSGYANGAIATSTIPANSILVYTVELVGIR